MIRELMDSSLSMSATAKALTLRGVATRKGGEWSAMQVSNILKRSVLRGRGSRRGDEVHAD
jgi:Recombinase